MIRLILWVRWRPGQLYQKLFAVDGVSGMVELLGGLPDGVNVVVKPDGENPNA